MNAFDLKRYKYALSFDGGRPVIDGITLAANVTEAASGIQRELDLGGYDKWHVASVTEIQAS